MTGQVSVTNQRQHPPGLDTGGDAITTGRWPVAGAGAPQISNPAPLAPKHGRWPGEPSSNRRRARLQYTDECLVRSARELIVSPRGDQTRAYWKTWYEEQATTARATDACPEPP